VDLVRFVLFLANLLSCVSIFPEVFGSVADPDPGPLTF
jgi:hypothetical protein